MSKRKPEEFTRMAVQAKKALVENGIPLNQFLSKVADDEKLTPKQTMLVANLSNRFVRNALAKEAAIVDFTVADPAEIENAVAARRVDKVLEPKATGASSGFNVQTVGPVQRSSDSVEWGKKASAPDYQQPAQKTREAKVELAIALEEMDVLLLGLQKHAGDTVSSGEVLMAAAMVDGDGLPICLEYCSQRLDVDDCDDVEKYASMDLDKGNEVVRGFERLKVAGLEYIEVMPEIEKQAFLAKLKGVGKALGIGGKALIASLFGLTVGGEAVRGAKLMSGGALKNTAPTAVQMAKKIGAPVVSPLGG